jgi:hypothetical protein
MLGDGRWITVAAGPSAEHDDEFEGAPLRFGRALRALSAARLVDGETGTALGMDFLHRLPMRDFHRLRDLLQRIGSIALEPDDGTCRNCDAALPFRPLDSDPRDLERSPSPGVQPEPTLVLPRRVRLPRGEIAESLTMGPVSLGDTLPLLAALARDERPRLTPRILRGLGVVAVGTLSQPALVARALERACPSVRRAIEARYLEWNHPGTVGPLVCPACGALHEVPTPWPREFEPEAEFESADHGEAFPSLEAFEDLVERIAPGVYARRGVRHVSLRVEPGVPATDLAGEPLLGSYEPLRDMDDAGYTRLEFCVTLYHRTFERMWHEEGPYDLDEEIRETIDHELEHHLHHLTGYDPLDADERAEARQTLRRLYGDRTLARLAMREAAEDVIAFLSATRWLLLIIAVGVVASVMLDRWR